VTKQRREAAAAVRVAAGLGRRKRGDLLGLLRPAFARTGPWVQAGRYVDAVMSDLPRRNGWTIARHAGDRSPDRTQRLLNRAAWDTFAAMGIVRRFAVAGLDEAAARAGRRCLAVGALDETGQEKKGTATAGVQRQHMGCAGGVENGINTVHLSYVREGTGHALIGARQWIPAGQIDDPVRSVVTALPLDLRFRTKGQLAIDVLGGAFADGITLDFVCGDEVYGSCTELREYLEERGQGYVLRVPSSFRVTLARGVTLTCAQVAGRLFAAGRRWEIRSAGKGSKGQRWYAWACAGTASPRHCLLIRRHLATGELAFHLCHVPEGQPAGMGRLIRAAGQRWPVEEDFGFAKDCFGLDQSQVRLYHAIARHTVLVMAGLAICAVTAALLRQRTSTQAAPPARPGQPPPASPGMIPLTVPEVRRLLAGAMQPQAPPGQMIHWSAWTRTHQARANWFHQRTRLERDQQVIMKPLAS
jgi:SRSO17 transposase